MKTLIALLAVLALFGCAAKAPAQQGQANVTAPQKEIAVLDTSKGEIQIELYRDRAPLSVDNFEKYVRSGFYNGTIFHRVIAGFMIQGGGFTADGNQKDTMPPIKLESGNGLGNSAGMVAMARTQDPDSATSQFFINTVDNPGLDKAPGKPGYAVFGKVISGMDVVHSIESARTWNNGFAPDWPVENITINGAYIKTG